MVFGMNAVIASSTDPSYFDDLVFLVRAKSEEEAVSRVAAFSKGLVEPFERLDGEEDSTATYHGVRKMKELDEPSLEKADFECVLIARNRLQSAGPDVEEWLDGGLIPVMLDR